MDLFVVFGGQSPEHAVSVQSALNILQHANRNKYRVFGTYIDQTGHWSIWRLEGKVDAEQLADRLPRLPRLSAATAIGKYFADNGQKVVFPIIHGVGGEDGALQGLWQSLQLPYVGCGVTGSAIGMDKAIMKRLMVALGIPVAPYISLTSEDFAGSPLEVVQRVEQQISYPCFVKPARGGSSIGITRVTDRQRLAVALQTAFAEDNKALIEREIVGREIEIGLLGNQPVHCSLPGEFVREPAFFDYRCKYLDQDLAMRIPADVSDQAYQEMCGYATAVFREFDCSGLFRADFFLTDTGAIYFNEINTLPGFTGFSMYPSLWAKAGLDLSGLIDQLVDLALRRRQAEHALNKGALVSD